MGSTLGLNPLQSPETRPLVDHRPKDPTPWLPPDDRPARILWTGTLAILNTKGAVRLPEMTPANTNTA